MKENTILKKAQAELESEGKVVWTSYKRTGFAQQDIFGIFDMVYLEHNDGQTLVGFIQCTTHHHLSDRRKKLAAFFRAKKLPVPPRCEIWGYDSEGDCFTKQGINHKKWQRKKRVK